MTPVPSRRVLVVTGGSQGIGAATCRLAPAQGWTVCFSYSSSSAPAAQLVAEIEAAGGQALAIKADAASEEDTIRLFNAAAALGPIEAVVANAGLTGRSTRLDALDASDLDRVLAVNVRGAVLTLRETARRMQRGAIVALSSRASVLGGAGDWVHYAASKGAVDTLVIGAAKELAPRGIRVNGVSPGLIDTPIHAKAGLHARIETMAPTIPLGRAGTAEEVAKAILWLLSDDASYITAAMLPVSGGR